MEQVCFNMKRLFVLIPFFGFFACTGGEKAKPVIDPKTGEEVVSGRKLYTNNCVVCHGEDGKLGNSGAKDLSISTLNDEELLDVIVNGKNGMMPYKSILKTEKEREAVVKYVKSLRN